MRKVWRWIKQIGYTVLSGVGSMARPLFNLFTYRNVCVVKIEGGLASQLEQYTLGQCFKKKGYSVYYDTSFYLDGCSFDVFGENARNFDITKLDRSIEIPELPKRKLWVMKRLFAYSTSAKKCEQVSSLKRLITPVYFGGYGYGIYSEEYFEETYSECVSIDYDKAVFGAMNSDMLKLIQTTEKSIAMHVRRGDTLLEKVGRPIPKKEYYLKALSYFDDDIPVYIFSDDMNWVKNSLLSDVPNSDRVTLACNNGADRGWCDLILMAACTYQIKSPTGGLGREAFRLNSNENKRLILPVYIPGNKCHMKGEITEIVLDDTLCDLQNVKNRDVRL